MYCNVKFYGNPFSDCRFFSGAYRYLHSYYWKYTSETWILTKRDRKQINIFERKMYRRILGPVYDKERECCRILNSKEIYAMVKKHTIAETKQLNRLRLFGHVQRMEENRIP